MISRKAVDIIPTERLLTIERVIVIGMMEIMTETIAQTGTIVIIKKTNTIDITMIEMISEIEM
jgi:hypothetical protein